MTSANVKRRDFYRTQIAQAATPRLRLWAAWRWLLAEATRAGAAERASAAERVESIAAELNGADQ